MVDAEPHTDGAARERVRGSEHEEGDDGSAAIVQPWTLTERWSLRRMKATSLQFGGRLLTSRNLTGRFRITRRCCRARSTRPWSRAHRTARTRCAAFRSCRPALARGEVMPANEGIEISASSPEYGEAKEAIEKEFKGEPISIGFNAQYLLDFLSAAPTGQSPSS